MFYLERLPCPVLITDCNGQIQHTNRDFKQLVASETHGTMDQYFPPSCHIFLHSYAWPLLLKNGEFNELYMQLFGADRQLIPVMTNARISEVRGERVVVWLFFVAKERQRFEAELLKARQSAQETARQLADVITELHHAYGQLSQYAQEAKNKADQFAHLSLTDPLTNLGNRRALARNVKQWMHTANNDSAGSLLLVDIDFFKLINDRFGHPEGDKTLIKLAKRLLESVRTNDTITRYGGEEFAIWLPNTNLEGAKLTAERIHNNVSQILVANEKITVSIGISCITQNGLKADVFLDKLIEQADAAVYAAKTQGRNQTIYISDIDFRIANALD